MNKNQLSMQKVKLDNKTRIKIFFAQTILNFLAALLWPIGKMHLKALVHLDKILQDAYKTNYNNQLNLFNEKINPKA